MLYTGLLDTIAYNGFLFFMFMLTISRFTIFFFNRIDEIIFKPPGIFIVIALVWLITLGFTVILNISGCWKEFTTNGYHINQICSTEWSLIQSENTTLSTQDFLNNIQNPNPDSESESRFRIDSILNLDSNPNPDSESGF
uniref:Uncharacterized protein n=1 Tax=Acrobeloides nanus TaxID=290746 RepID=A0A914C5T6_9BILA